jgi:hypothetical protein
VVLHHLEALSEETARVLASWLERAPSRPWLVATLTTAGTGTQQTFLNQSL